MISFNQFKLIIFGFNADEIDALFSPIYSSLDSN